jgi:glycosyltransferase involved in cell wall biosynthesis
MDSAASISVCMVVKDEADFLERSLTSILPAVQEVIRVDTGSSDETLQSLAASA